MVSTSLIGDRHIRAMVAVWQKERLAPATIQTYLSSAITPQLCLAEAAGRSINT